MDTFRFPKVNTSFPTAVPLATSLNRMDMNLIVIFSFLAIALAVADFCRLRAEAKAAAKAAAKVKEAKEASDREDLMKRIESVEVTHNTFMTNYKDLILHLATLHKARLVRDDMRRKYNDNTRRSAELITANHNAIMAYKKEKDTLSAYLIQYT
jgi:hypothetical protein